MVDIDLGNESFFMPAEWERHEGTWLQWPHDLAYLGNQLKLERMWLMMVDALHNHETVHIIVLDERQRDHIESQLKYFGIGLKNIDFHIVPSDGNWVRDNGPIFVLDQNGELAITNWVFNGWGNRFDHQADNQVPTILGGLLSIPVYSPAIILEGGAVEVNGKGTFMATRSSIINPNRNPGKSRVEIEEVIARYLGVTHFIWLSGTDKIKIENWGGVTDAHIDGAARFVSESTVLYVWTEDQSNPVYPIYARHLEELKEATTESGKPLTLVPVPAPVGGVYQTSFPISGKGRKPIRAPATYCNYLVANGVVLVPVYGNANDQRALKIIGEHFPDRNIVGIESVGLIEDGGAIHCITQQQPAVVSQSP